MRFVVMVSICMQARVAQKSPEAPRRRPSEESLAGGVPVAAESSRTPKDREVCAARVLSRSLIGTVQPRTARVRPPFADVLGHDARIVIE